MKSAQEFQPDAIMLETHAPPVPLHIIWYIIIALVIGFIVWACYAHIDKVVVASGKIVTERPNIVMKPFERATVQKVHVRTGQVVKEGELLFTFDQTNNKAELERISEQLAAFKAHRDRLQAEIDGYDKEFKLPANPNLFEILQHNAFEARKNSYNGRLLSYDATEARYQKTLEQLHISMEKFEARKDKLDEIEAMMKGFEDTRVVSLRDYLNIQVQVIETAISVDQQKVSIVENEQAIKSVKAERDSFISDWHRQIYEELVDIDRNISSLQQQIVQTARMVQYTELRSPCDAVVHEIAPFQEGSAVREAESLITLIPINEKFEVEVYVPAKDISWVRLGQTCRIKFDTYPFQQCGTREGKITYISEDAFTGNERMMSDDAMTGDAGGRLSKMARGTTYQARIELEPGDFRGWAKGARILPGMTVNAEIKVGDRTVINYIINPFVKALDESAREP
ncbi:MAG: HlyD family type I secretion periplasmic adaptor subunit [Lentisphaeria bacterium]|nr:HlyD family type I secretion periplasmic adaptor subunit [Lentisphaeria bacterium]